MDHPNHSGSFVLGLADDRMCPGVEPRGQGGMSSIEADQTQRTLKRFSGGKGGAFVPIGTHSSHRGVDVDLDLDTCSAAILFRLWWRSPAGRLPEHQSTRHRGA